MEAKSVTSRKTEAKNMRGIEDEKSKESIQCFSMFSADAGPIGVGGLCLGRG